MQNLNTLTVNLMVEDMIATIKFYTDNLGFKLLVPSKNELTENCVWALLKKDHVQIMFQPVKTLQSEFPELSSYQTGGGFTLFIQIDNIEEYYESISDKSLVIRTLGSTSYNNATEFVIQDLNGIILHFSDYKF